MRTIFLEESYTKCAEETIARPFSKKSKLSKFIFVVCQVEDYQNILKISCRQLAFTSYKSFLKNKKRSGTSLPAKLSA